MKNCKLMQMLRALSRKKKIGLVCGLVCLLICAGLLYIFPVYRVSSMTCGDKYFDREDLALLRFRGTPGDRRAAEAVMEQARAALNDRETPCNIYGENDPRRAKYGELWRLVTGPDGPEKYKLELLSAHLGENEGKLWICYSRGTSGRNEVELWTVQRIDGEWVVVDTVWEC